MTPRAPGLRPWPRDAAARRAYVDAVFRRVAPRYDALTRLLSLGQDRRWKRALVARLPEARPGGALLDLATGTGEFPALLRDAGRTEAVVAIDRSRPMLDVARRRALDGVRFVVGDLNALPAAAGRYDAVLMGYGLRYPMDLRATLAAIHGALRPGGVFLSLDFGVPEAPFARGLATAYLLTAGTLWGLLLHGRPSTYWHIVESIRAYPGPRAVAALLREVGFARVSVETRLWGGAAMLTAERGGAPPGGRRPERRPDPQPRSRTA